MKVAVAQFASGRDKQANREQAVALIRDAADRGAGLVVLPEAAMYTFGRPDDPLAEAAEPLDGPFVTALTKAAADAGLTVIAGMFEAIPGEDLVFNTVVALDADGVRGQYRKLHLFDALGWRESERLKPGVPSDAGALLTLPVGDRTVGVLTCYDLRFPEIARALVDAGADLLAVPAAWVAGPLKEDHWATLVRARAIENTCYVAAAGQPPRQYVGRSMVVDPMGVALAQLGEVDGVAVADADSERLSEVRSRLPSLQHRRYAVVPLGSAGGAAR